MTATCSSSTRTPAASPSSTAPTPSRRLLAGRVGRHLVAELRRPATGGLDLGRRRRAADPARAGPLRRGRRRGHRPRHPHHRARAAMPATSGRPATRPGTANSALPPMGERLRLKASFDISTFSPANQVILQALKTYGAIVADNGSPWYISGVPDSRWNNDDLHLLGQIKGSDFEAVDESSLMVDPELGSDQAGGAAAPAGRLDEPRRPRVQHPSGQHHLQRADLHGHQHRQGGASDNGGDRDRRRLHGDLDDLRRRVGRRRPDLHRRRDASPPPRSAPSPAWSASRTTRPTALRAST